MIIATLLMALRELRRNLMRSTLTALGIVIGVGAVIGMVTFGNGATEKVRADVAKMGNNMLQVSVGSNRRGGPAGSLAPNFTMTDVNAVRREVTAASMVAPSVGRSQLTVYGNKNRSTSTTGTTNEFFEIRGYTLTSGRFFNDTELQGGVAVCVIGETVRSELFGTQEPVGETMRVGSLSCKVIGLLTPKGLAAFGQDQDDLIVMPLTTFQRRITGNTDVTSIYVSAASEESIPKAKSQLEALFTERRRIQPGAEANFNVRDVSEVGETLSSVTGAMTSLLGAIAAVSLLVGGIGIMNIMLVSVTERTREIGVRLAIGARAHEVLFQFLVEAVMLSLLGGLLGIAIGLGGSYVGTQSAGLPFVTDPWIIMLAVGFSGAIGVGFGYFPARKAASLNPIEALRHE